MAIDNATDYANSVGQLSQLIRIDPNVGEQENILETLQFAANQRLNLSAFVPADTITYVLDGMSAVGTYCQYGIDIAWGEGKLQTARLDDSKRALIRSQSVRQRRKTPAFCTVLFTRQDGPSFIGSMTVQPLTQFSSNNVYYFNRDPIVFADGEEQVEATLYQGQIVNASFLGNDQDFSKIVVSVSGFAVSDDDVYVDIDGETLTVTKKPLWRYQNVFDQATSALVYRNNVVENFTLSTGECEIRFGSDQFARKPLSNETINLTYAITLGSAGANNGSIGATFLIDQPDLLNDEIIGTGTSILAGGADEIDADTYQRAGPFIFSAQRTAIDNSGYQVVPLDFPGVLSAVAQRQAVYAPDDIRYMNFIRMSLLTTSPITDAYWTSFVTFMQENSSALAHFIRYDPIPLITDVVANVYIPPSAVPSVVRTAAIAAVTQLFAPKYGMIGLEISQNDIEETITNSTPGINWCDLVTPTQNIFSTAKSPINNGSVISQTGGTLPPGEYQYFISTITGVGETLPAKLPNLAGTGLTVTTNTGEITLNWIAEEFGHSYNIYRKSGDTAFLLAQIDNLNTITFVDDGSFAESTTKMPLIDTSGIYYPMLGNLTINVLPTDRVTLINRKL